MCGICGISGNLANNSDVLALLLMANEVRGRDATGYAYHHTEQDNSFFWRKDGVPATKFVTKYLFDNMKGGFKADNIIGHTRAGTGGVASDNKNNHPFITNDMILIHNGILYNDELLTTKYKLERNAITDSEVIPLMLEKKGLEGLEEIDGSYALAWFDMNAKNSLFLARNDGSPLYIGYKHEAMLFSSISHSLTSMGCKDIEQIPIGEVLEFVNGKCITNTKFTPKSYMTHLTRYYNGYGCNSYDWTRQPPYKETDVWLLGKRHVYDYDRFTYVPVIKMLDTTNAGCEMDYRDRLDLERGYDDYEENYDKQGRFF